jgi:hypothetical protein
VAVGPRPSIPRVPPGQYVTQDFPVLSAGPAPRTSPGLWDFSIVGELAEPRGWTGEEFRALPSEEITRDIHCVTALPAVPAKAAWPAAAAERTHGCARQGAWRCGVEGRFDMGPGHTQRQQDCNDAGCEVPGLELPGLEGCLLPVTLRSLRPALGRGCRCAPCDQAHARSGPGEPAAAIASGAACPVDRHGHALLLSALRASVIS